MIVVFSHTRKLLLIWGLLFTFSNHIAYVSLSYFIQIIIFLASIANIRFVLQNISDITKISEAMSLGAGVLSGLVKLTLFLYHRKLVRKLLIDLQRLVDKQTIAGRSYQYYTMNRHINKISRIFATLLISTLIPMCLGSLLLIVPHIRRGDTKPEMWTYPLSISLPYETSGGSLWYGLTYLIISLALVSAASVLLAIGCMFMGACLNIVAALRDLSEMIAEIDRIFPYKDDLYYAATRDLIAQKNVHNHLAKCFRFHAEILRIIETLGDIFSPIIFSQYFFSVGGICTLVFGIQSPSVSLQIKIINILTSLCFLCELGIYCYFGNEITLHTQKVADATYQTAWYRIGPKVRRFIWMLLIRNQKLIYIRGLGLIDCSMETFLAVLNMVGSLLALLQSVT